jgi:hypothetical protein
MFNGKTVHLLLSLVFYSSVTVFGQWSAANSGTTNNLNGEYLLDSGVGFVVGDAGTIVKTTDAGMTWSPLTSGTTNALHDGRVLSPYCKATAFAPVDHRFRHLPRDIGDWLALL